MNLVLIGYRGTGKTTIGRLLAAELGMRYVGFDVEITKRVGIPIPDIVKRFSWNYFRDREEEVVADFSAADNLILDAGGGVVTRPVNIERLRQNGRIFLLVADLKDIVARISADTQRPSLTGAKSFTEEVADVLAEREPLYRAAADHVIDTSRLGPEEAVREIVREFRKDDG